MAKRRDEEGPPVAIKRLKKAALIRQKQVDHITSERRILATVHHPFLVCLKSAVTYFDITSVNVFFPIFESGSNANHIQRRPFFVYRTGIRSWRRIFYLFTKVSTL